MKRDILKLLILVLSSAFMFVSHADFAFSGSSVNSLSISSERSENDKAYNLKIYINGIEPSQVETKVIDQRFFIKAQNGGVISGNAIAGGQFINYSYLFADDADMKKLTRTNSNKLISVTVPKLHK